MGRMIGWLFGGACVAAGVLTLFYSFSAPYGDVNQHLDRAGWDAMGDFGPTGWAIFAFGFIGIGASTLIGLNATAWKATNGY